MGKNKLLFVIIAVFVLALTVIYTISNNDEGYITQITKERTEHQQYLRSKTNSPITEKDGFLRADFFDIDIDFRVRAKIERIADPEIVKVGTSTEEHREYLKYAILKFKLKGVKYELPLYQDVDNDAMWFLPFTDLTNGELSYGAGRYLPVDASNKDFMELDFNRAFNPTCAYNHDFSCPVPPRSNHLNIEIGVGEKKPVFKDK